MRCSPCPATSTTFVHHAGSAEGFSSVRQGVSRPWWTKPRTTPTAREHLARARAALAEPRGA